MQARIRRAASAEDYAVFAELTHEYYRFLGEDLSFQVLQSTCRTKQSIW